MGRVHADDFKALWIEFGTGPGGPTQAFATLRLAAEAEGLDVRALRVLEIEDRRRAEVVEPTLAADRVGRVGGRRFHVVGPDDRHLPPAAGEVGRCVRVLRHCRGDLPSLIALGFVEDLWGAGVLQLEGDPRLPRPVPARPDRAGLEAIGLEDSERHGTTPEPRFRVVVGRRAELPKLPHCRLRVDGVTVVRRALRHELQRREVHRVDLVVFGVGEEVDPVGQVGHWAA